MCGGGGCSSIALLQVRVVTTDSEFYSLTRQLNRMIRGGGGGAAAAAARRVEVIAKPTTHTLLN